MLNKNTFVFDIDGTLCPIKQKHEEYEDLTPYKDIIDKIRVLHNMGAYIILYTSRNMNSYKGNMGLINKNTAPVLYEWLKKWNIPYDEIVFGKVWPGHHGFYVDDRTIRPDEFLDLEENKWIELCNNTRNMNTKFAAPLKLQIVITMGGLGQRFIDAGYKMPKYMIEINGKTLFEWSLLSLSGFSDCVVQYIFIARVIEDEDVQAFIAEKCKKLGIQNYKIKMIDYLTEGQAATAMLAKEFWDESDSLLIYNIDTYVEPGNMRATQIVGDGFIPCFIGEGDHWSFVKIDSSGKAVEVREKSRISEFCTIGAYYFKSCSLYEELYNQLYGNKDWLRNCQTKEQYVAPVYDILIKNGGKVYISNIESKAVHVLGTPDELEEFQKDNYLG